MPFLPLMDQPLKRAEIVDLLEHHGMEVVYEFDRLFEGTEDEYRSRSEEGGFEFIFDASQRLSTVFLCIRPHGAFAAIDGASLDVPVYASLEEARGAFERSGSPVAQGEDWIKGRVAGIWRHYAFRDGALSMVTLMRDSL